MTNNGEIVGYFPVIHAGYLELLQKHPEADVSVLDADVLARFDYLRKDVRALRPESAVDLLNGIGRNSRLIGERGLRLTMMQPHLIMPDDDVSRALAKEFDAQPHFEPVFLRWDRQNTMVNKEVHIDRAVKVDADDPVLATLREQAESSTNWWRHVAAAIVQNETVIGTGHNSSVPTPYSSAIDSDPRIISKRGQSIEVSIDVHAEAKLIANLAKNGDSTEGSDIYVTTFPCPNCAKLIAESGIKSCYFVEGYAMLDGESILRSANVEIVKVDIENDERGVERSIVKPYPSKS